MCSEHQKLIDGQYSFVFAHPEQVIDNKTLNDIWLSEYFQHQAKTFIVIDEAHCILDWGLNFRPAFQNLFKLRALFSNANLLALSATLSCDGQHQVAKKLGMKDYKSVAASPARENISFVVCKRPPTAASARNSVEYVVEPLLVELLRSGQEFPLTIVYFSGSMVWVGVSYEMAVRMLGEKFYSGGQDLQHARVVQYHSSLEKEGGEVKKTILENLTKDPEESPLKLIFATVALGMGADLRHVTRVVHIGPPKQLEAYIQQVGRAGRSGKQSVAVMYYNNSDVGRPEVSQEMKQLCRNTSECRRVFVNKGFGFETASTVSSEVCCDICNPELMQGHLPSFTSPELKGTLRNAILDYIGRDSTNYLQEKLPVSRVQQVLCSPNTFKNPDVFIQEFGLSQNVAISLSHIIEEITKLHIQQ
ncbi:hypothetical protein ScPMuIL_002317 [Solemya velum]